MAQQPLGSYISIIAHYEHLLRVHLCSSLCPVRFSSSVPYFPWHFQPYFMNRLLQLSSACTFHPSHIAARRSSAVADKRHCIKQKAELLVSVKHSGNQRTEHHTCRYVCKSRRPGSGSGSGSWSGAGFYYKINVYPMTLGS